MSDKPGTVTESVNNSENQGSGSPHPVPGLLLVFSLGQPRCVVMPLRDGRIELGREDGPALLPADPKMSRRHAAVTFDGQRFQISDLGSHNGSFLDGRRLQPSVNSATARVLRTGDTLYLLSPDLRALEQHGVRTRDELVCGPTLQDVFAQAGRAAQFGRTLHITGESGSGKEGVARAFHAGSSFDKGPFVALNCATIAAGVAERLLFGARRGAFSGAITDAEGLVQAADGGTLFLDEIGELDLAVQAKLLRVLETREVLQMGAVKPRRVNLQLCSASHRELRSEVAEGRFREDLYFRISRPEIVVPPLRQRLEEVPWLIDLALRNVAAGMMAHSTYVEACMLRHWPGNVRELLGEVRASAQKALGLGTHRLEAQHLDARAGVPLQKAAEASAIFAPASTPQPKIARSTEREKIEAALRQAGGNISAAARALGLHRTQLTRLMEKLEISAQRSETAISEEDGED